MTQTNALKRSRVKFSEESMLFDFVKCNDEVSVRRLLLENKLKKTINSKNQNGNTLLHEAVCNGWYEIVCQLIRKGSNINSTNNYKETPLHLACSHGKYEIAQKLLESGANHRALDRDGYKPFNLICEQDMPLQMLVQFYMSISYESQNFNF